MTFANWQVPVSALGNADSFRNYINTIFEEIRDSQPGSGSVLPPIADQREGRLFVVTPANTLYQAQSGAWVAL